MRGLCPAAAPVGGASRLALPAALRSAPRRSAAPPLRRVPTALFGPSKEELALKLKLQDAEASLAGAHRGDALAARVARLQALTRLPRTTTRAEAVRRAAEATTALEAERAARAKADDTVAMYLARLKEAEKDVFKLERQLEEREKAFVSYQARASERLRLGAPQGLMRSRVRASKKSAWGAADADALARAVQTTAEKQIERMAAAMKAAGVTLQA